MKKTLLKTTFFLVALLILSSASFGQAFTQLHNFSNAGGNKPTWFAKDGNYETRGMAIYDGKLYFASATSWSSNSVAPVIHIFDLTTATKTGELSVTGIVSDAGNGFRNLNDIEFSQDGILFGANIGANFNMDHSFKVWQFSLDPNVAPVKVLDVDRTLTNGRRLGDIITIVGRVDDGSLAFYAASTESPGDGNVFVWKMNGINQGIVSFGEPVQISHADLVRGAFSAVAPLPDGKFYWHGGAVNLAKFNENGSKIGDVTHYQWRSGGIKYLGKEGNDEFIAFYRHTETQLMFYRITNGNPATKTQVFATANAGLGTANASGAGKVVFTPQSTKNNGNAIIAYSDFENGFAVIQTNNLNLEFPVYQGPTNPVVNFTSGVNGTIAATVDGSPIVSGANVEEGKDVVFTATPAAGYYVSGWYLNGVLVEGNTSNTFTITGILENSNVLVLFKDDWEMFHLSVANHNLPSWFDLSGNGHRGLAVFGETLYVHRIADNRLTLLNKNTGAFIEHRNLTGIVGGLQTIASCDVEVDEDGVVLVGNVAQDNDSGTPREFRVYTVSGSAATRVLNFPIPGGDGRLGDKFTVRGRLADKSAKIYAVDAKTGKTSIYVFSMLETPSGDILFDAPTVLTLGTATGTSAKVAPTSDGMFYFTGGGVGVSKLNADGSLAGTISLSIVPITTSSVEFLLKDGDDDIIAVYESGATAERVRIVRVPGGNPASVTAANVIYTSPAMRIDATNNSNGNATGDVAVFVSPSKTNQVFEVFVLGTNNGISGFTNTQYLGYVTVLQGSWTNPTTWLGGLIPDETTDATVKHAVTITGEAKTKDLDIDLSGSVTIESGGTLTVEGTLTNGAIASDKASNYTTWPNGSNQGSGFGPWDFTSSGGSGGSAGTFLGNPSAAGITNMDNPSFGLYANPKGSGAYVNADREFSGPLDIGATFSVDWAVNWDSDGSGNKGLNIYAGGVGGTQLININQGGSAAITINGNPMFNNYGTDPITLNFEYFSAGQLRVHATGRDNSESFDQTFTVSGAPDAVRFYASDLASGNQRQPYFNNLKIDKSGPPAALVIKDGGSLIHNTASVAATVERDMPVNSYRLVSPPVSGMDVYPSDWAPTLPNTTYDLYWFKEDVEESGGYFPWINIRATGGAHNTNFGANFIAGRGYLSRFTDAGTKAFAGNLNSGDVAIGITHTAAAPDAIKGWNIIGNPYPSGYDWVGADYSAILEDNYAYTLAGSTYTPLATGTLAANQGFFVKKKDVVEPNFTFLQSRRVHGGTFTKQGQINDQLVLSVTNGTLTDYTTLQVVDGTSFDRDRWDALKLNSLDVNERPQLFTQTANNIKVAINSVPQIEAQTEVTVGVEIPATGQYTISIDQQGGLFQSQPIYLKDMVTGLVHDLGQNPSVSFMADQGSAASRFKLMFTQPTSVEPVADNSTQVYVWNNQIMINFAESLENRALQVFDTGGRLVMSQQLGNQTSHTLPINLNSGVYLVRITSAAGVFTQRVVVR